MSDNIACECGQGEKVFVSFGFNGELTACCTCTIAKYEAMHGKFKWKIVREDCNGCTN